MARVGIISGASRGIGAAIASRLASDGVITHLLFRQRSADAEAVKLAIEGNGGVARLHQIDISSEADVRNLIADVEDADGRIDILVNNAGIADEQLIMATTTEQWQRVLTVDLTAAFWLIRESVPLMMDNGWGRIINITSTSAATPGPGQCAYAAAKGGLEALTRAVAAEVGHKGIRVNAVAPGAIISEMTERLREKLGGKSSVRWGQPEEIAGLVSFLASDEADYIQGQLFTVDGGRSTARPRLRPASTAG